MGGNVTQAATLEHLTISEHEHAVRQRVGVDGVVRDEQRAALERVELAAQLVTDVAARRRVECGQRLVEQEHPRRRRQRAGQRDALLLAARQPQRAGSHVLGQAHAGEPRRRLATSLGPPHAAGAQAERHVLGGVEVGEEQVVLEHHPDRSLLGRYEHRRRRIVEHDAVDLDAPVVQRGEPGEQREHRALAGPVRAEERYHLAVGEIDRRVEHERSAAQP